MSSSSSNSSDPTDASQPRTSAETKFNDTASDSESHSASASRGDSLEDIESESLETFEFEVSAGNLAKTEDSGKTGPIASKAKLVEPQPADIKSVDSKPVKSQLIESKPTESQPSNQPGIVSNEGPQKKSARQVTKKPKPVPVDAPVRVEIPPKEVASPFVLRPTGRIGRQSSWWITSLGVHILLLLALAFSTLVVIREEKLELYASTAAYEPVEEFQDLEIDPSEELDSLEESLDEPDADTLAELTTETLIEEPTLNNEPLAEFASADGGALTEVANLFGDTGTGMSGLDNEVGSGKGGAMAKFFGTEIKARRILYMLDNSGGMRKDGKFEALISELQASVRALNPKQKFYVIFYSDTVYPLFFPYSVREFVRSTPKSQKKLDAWLDSVELCGGNAIDEALAAAEVIRPDAVFLLTDGYLFTLPRKKALLLNSAGRSYAIHTFGLGVKKDSKASGELKQVAEANKGTFRAIKVTSEMKALAEEKQRPYHNKRPGPIWGIKVGTR